MKNVVLWVLLSSLLAPVASAQPPSDPLASLRDERIDLEVKDAPVADLLTLLGDIGQARFEVSACVSGVVSLELQSVTARTVLLTIGDSLGLAYSAGKDGAVVVDCVPALDEEARIDFEASDLPLADVLSMLGEAGGTSIESESCEGLRVDLRVERASPQTVLREVVSQAGATLGGRAEDGFVVRCEPE